MRMNGSYYSLNISGQHEHTCSAAIWLTYQGQDCSTWIRLGLLIKLLIESRRFDQSSRTKHAGFFFVSITVLGHFIAPGWLCLRLVGSRERAGLNTHSNTHDTHTNGKESTDPGIVSHSQNELWEKKKKKKWKLLFQQQKRAQRWKLTPSQIFL